MEYFLIFTFGVIIFFIYLRQEKFNRLMITYFLRNRFNSDNAFDDAISHIYINDAVKIKKYLKHHFDNMIDVDSDPLFKDIKK